MKMKTYQEIQSTSYRWFDVMLMLLSCVAGSTDIISYYRLGHVFTANMTGNVILLGISIGQGELSTSLYRVASLAGFFAGVFIGALIVENKSKKKKWAYFVMVATAVESAIIATLAIIWLTHDGPLKNSTLYIAILLSAISMGMQSATIWHLDIPGVVTTFITGNITSIGMSAIKGLRQGFKKDIKTNASTIPFIVRNPENRIELQLVVLGTYIFAAIFTGWMENFAPRFLPLLPLMLILGVVAILWKHMKKHQ